MEYTRGLKERSQALLDVLKAMPEKEKADRLREALEGARLHIHPDMRNSSLILQLLEARIRHRRPLKSLLEIRTWGQRDKEPKQESRLAREAARSREVKEILRILQDNDEAFLRSCIEACSEQAKS